MITSGVDGMCDCEFGECTCDDGGECPLCGESDCHQWGNRGICTKCVMDAANDYVFTQFGKRDWRFATAKELEQDRQEREKRHNKQKKVIPSSLRTAVFERDSYRCLACGIQKSLRCDHVVPESKGGSMSIENMQTLCVSCNTKKGTKVIDYRTNFAHSTTGSPA